ncbi:DUF983 domain-containing protein [Roseinatronobacter sp. S2]|uniref:DUF983 domain-containing protein n=1 Tax=Roseinatronobacter sp. S2 TaxID=3035471 RepID=UPI00240F495F|nr:DUF983 domain-containing protein [Roseinatronobacter sp. S2]WFE76571.1 DUF983 domain-containing protein [Roseinatronobacter sp. S2]
MTSNQPREMGEALRRGAAGRCPNCGMGRLFDGYLGLHESCAQCGLDLRPYTPAAGPAFLTVAVLGVLTGPLLWAAAAIFTPDRLVLALVGVTALPILAVLLLRVIKGAMVGYLWALGAGNHDTHGQG